MRKWKESKVVETSESNKPSTEDILQKSLTENPSIIRSNPLYKDGDYETDNYEVMSLSSGYYSTFNSDTSKQDTSVIQEEADDTAEYNTEASMKTAHPHLPPLDSFAIDCEIKGSNNSNWYLLKRFGLDQEEKFSEYQPSNQRNRTQHNVYHLKTEGSPGKHR